jgi:hypothetical protein
MELGGRRELSLWEERKLMVFVAIHGLGLSRTGLPGLDWRVGSAGKRDHRVTVRASKYCSLCDTTSKDSRCRGRTTGRTASVGGVEVTCFGGVELVEKGNTAGFVVGQAYNITQGIEFTCELRCNLTSDSCQASSPSCACNSITAARPSPPTLPNRRPIFHPESSAVMHHLLVEVG